MIIYFPGAIEGLPAHDALLRLPLVDADKEDGATMLRLRDWYGAMERAVGSTAAIGGESPWQRSVRV
tara:strand:+ start:342 stop:542 length:201 start_codon:yes stop_codon:yes gene_type:complete